MLYTVWICVCNSSSSSRPAQIRQHLFAGIQFHMHAFASWPQQIRAYIRLLCVSECLACVQCSECCCISESGLLANYKRFAVCMLDKAIKIKAEWMPSFAVSSSVKEGHWSWGINSQVQLKRFSVRLRDTWDTGIFCLGPHPNHYSIHLDCGWCCAVIITTTQFILIYLSSSQTKFMKFGAVTTATTTNQITIYKF